MIWILFVVINNQMLLESLVAFNMSTRQFNHLDIPIAIVKSNAAIVKYRGRVGIMFC